MDIKEIALKLQATDRFRLNVSELSAIEFAEALIESYKAELLNEAGEPELYGFEDGELVCAQDMVCMAHKTGQRVTPFYTSNQVAAAIVKATGPLEDQLATAEQRVAEACAYLAHQHMDADIAADAINNGEWRKFVKEV